MILRAHIGMTPFLPNGLNSLAMCALTLYPTLYPTGHPSNKVSFCSISVYYSHTGSNHLPQSYVVLRSLYGLRPEILVWVGRTSMGLDFKAFQNTNLLKSINYILQLTHNEVNGGSSHPRLFSFSEK